MAIVKPFRGLRPPRAIAKDLACLPYDVMNSEEAAEMAKGKECSLLHITRSEIDLKADTDTHSDEVYNKSVENFKKWQEKGWLVHDTSPMYYIYAQTMSGRTQYGIVGCAAVSDYLKGNIKKHELTRPDKEQDRMIHVRVNNANIEPVFFAYPAVKEIDNIVNKITGSEEPEYDFIAEDGFGHQFWVVREAEINKKIEKLFAKKVPCTYVADGHHRTAAAALVGKERMDSNPKHKGNEEYNFFLAVHFPDDQLRIMDYNRTIKDLNGLTPEELLASLGKSFVVQEKGTKIYTPSTLHNFSMYLGGKWYSLTAKEGTYDDNDPIGVLDVTILTNHILSPILDIQDLRRSKRIDFVGGIRGPAELKKRVDSGEMKVAFALFPVSMKQLITIADSGNIMPPKTTWFEPKLRSGLVIHLLT
ncbi:MAG: hypothetical protein A2X05_18555 [Bacteroidetes bacterium GWE2_41_25]|nr:MAG: hypothetical protein A2X03_12325 [Bacteroidetes bacterium GWA2_40_15]OFX93688.1 MAG: hypothetical protein A2X06_05820 [Bacteroidetes bacterium GWC2_40_22]OFY01584.1 MAG: hypothetical protein A2X05_18555 [Bacteroidetes bacterium GWE2_41_25]OFY60345.1 MAG: hypothetical protein A2X04_04005 [Bacteroidetes bacterium GWF2_41_9]HAM09813.1 DUF1015 domain-containing protein [Bacteroidales bacterium]